MLLVYSDLAQLFWLQDENRIADLVARAGLKINDEFEIPMSVSDKGFDPLKNYKSQAKV